MENAGWLFHVQRLTKMLLQAGKVNVATAENG
jgi:hypothetical protein